MNTKKEMSKYVGVCGWKPNLNAHYEHALVHYVRKNRRATSIQVLFTENVNSGHNWDQFPGNIDS